MSDSLALGYSNIYFGRKGGGKTQQAVIDAYDAYKRGEIVISNIWLAFPHIRFHDSPSLVPILNEIGEYCNDHVMAIEAPTKMLKEYGMVRKKGSIYNFFLLFDEIGNHLNNRNWQKNFREPMLRDMLTEPRKYKMTIVGVCQSWQDVDVAFLRACEDWFLFSKGGKWIFQHFKSTHFWVINGILDMSEPYIIDRRKKFAFFWKMLIFYRSQYWTGEIVGHGAKRNMPHQFKTGDIYKIPAPVSDPVFPLIQPVPEEGAEALAKANMGGAGGNPTATNNLFPLFTAHVESKLVGDKKIEKTKRVGRPRKENSESQMKNKRSQKKKIQ